MEKIRTITREFDCDYFNPCPPVKQTNIRVLGSSVVEVANVFSDPEETSVMKYGNMCASGYTKLKAIIPEGDAIRVVLEQE